MNAKPKEKEEGAGFRPAGSRRVSVWRLRYAIPPEKGGWIWWIGPLFIGLAAAHGFAVDFLVLALAAFSGFCMRQPMTLLVKILRRGRNPEDLRPALFWTAVHNAVLATTALTLILRGHYWIFGLAAIGTPLFFWHLWLVGKGDERHHVLLDIVAAGILALSAPAAYWACGGDARATALLVWAVPTLQSSASILHMFLRLRQRRLDRTPALTQRLREGAAPLLHHLGNAAIASAATLNGSLHGWVGVAFWVCLAEGAHAVLFPPVKASPKQLGMRQLWVSGAFVALTMLGFYLQTRRG